MSEDVKKRILESAARLFAKQGYAGTSVRQICDEAGANVALVSYHFGGKEKLLTALLDTLFPSGDYYEQTDQIEDPILRIKELIRQFIPWIRSHREIAKIIMQEITLQTERMEMFRPFLYPVWRSFRRALVEGKEQGRLDFDSLDQAQLHVMGTLIFPLHSHFITPMLDDPQYPPLEIEIRERTRYMLRGLGAHPTDIE